MEVRARALQSLVVKESGFLNSEGLLVSPRQQEVHNFKIEARCAVAIINLKYLAKFLDAFQ